MYYKEKQALATVLRKAEPAFCVCTLSRFVVDILGGW